MNVILDNMWLIWLIVGVVLIILEMLTTSLVALFIGIGAFAGMIMALMSSSLIAQIIAAIIVSAIGIAFCRPFFSKIVKLDKPVVPSTTDALIGKTAMVIQELSGDTIGLVKVNSDTWSALSIDESLIKANTKVVIEKVDGAMLIVKHIKLGEDT